MLFKTSFYKADPKGRCKMLLGINAEKHLWKCGTIHQS